MNYNFEIQKILLSIEKLSNAEDKISLLKQAVNIADSNNDIDWGFDLRNLIIRNEGLLIKRDESFPAFTWILNSHDKNSGVFEDEDVLYNYMWMISIVFCNASVNKIQIDNIMSDYKDRLGKGGYSLRTYYELLIDWYLFVGESNKAQEHIKLRDKTPIDNLSSEAEVLTDACVALLDGNLDKGIALSQEYINRDPENQNNIFNTYNQLIYYLNKARDKRAKSYFNKSEAIFSKLPKSSYLLFEVSLMMYYMSRNEQEKAWIYFESYAEWEIGANDYSSFDFSLAVLPLFCNDEVKILNMNIKLPYYKEDNIYKTSDLHNYYYNKAVTLAHKFDLRNGNSYFTDQIQWHLQD